MLQTVIAAQLLRPDMKKRIPYSTVNYEKLVTEEYYMVDKSRFIAELEQYEIPLFLRPRRFGKSMFCSMLEHYYDIRFASRFDELFGHTDIGRHPTRKHNQYTVLMLDFSGMTTTTADLATLEFRFCQKISNAFWHFFDNHDLPCPDFIPPLPPASFTEPPPSTKVNMPTASEMLDNLIRHVKALRLPPLYVIIDEYDNFANHLILAHQDDIYTSATGKDSFLKSFFATLKNATQCGQVANCFLTGILPITVNDLNSGFSIACNVTLMPALHDMLGFTKDETRQYVSQIFADYGYPTSRLETALDQMQNFYDGYIFRPDAKHHLFNSSISNYYLFSLLAEEGTLPTDPVDVNQSLDMGWIVRLAGTSQSALAFVQRLLQGEPLPFNRSDLSLQFNLGQFLTPEFLPAALFFLGQLTWVGDGLLGFPNFTIRTQFLQIFQSMSKLAIPQDNIRELFLQYQQNGDLATLAKAQVPRP